VKGGKGSGKKLKKIREKYTKKLCKKVTDRKI
jgi:hypothetical protein